MYPKKFLLYIISFLLIAGYCISCKCRDKKCEGLDAKHLPLVDFNVGDSIKFRNDNGNEINFIITQQSAKQNTTVDCHTSSLTCYCQDCPETQGELNSTSTDTSRKWVDTLGNTKRTFSGLHYTIRYSRLDYTILDHRNTIQIDSSYNIYGNDSIVSSLTIGPRTYNDVVIHHTDTTVVPNYPNLHVSFFVITSYSNKEDGLIGFYDLQTQSLFYRE